MLSLLHQNVFRLLALIILPSKVESFVHFGILQPHDIGNLHFKDISMDRQTNKTQFHCLLSARCDPMAFKLFNSTDFFNGLTDDLSWAIAL